jgi:GNAT superfamily N-acetyltransferase
MRTDIAPATARHTHNVHGAWLARRWYYTPKSHRAYSVRQISPGDRRLLAEFALGLNHAGDRDPEALRVLTEMLFDRVISGSGTDMATGFAALEGTAAGDRIIGVAACAPESLEEAGFSVAVASGYRDEQVGRILLSTLVRHAKRVGVRRLTGDMLWSNRAMHLLAQSMGFAVEPVASDRNLRRLVLTLK